MSSQSSTENHDIIAAKAIAPSSGLTDDAPPASGGDEPPPSTTSASQQQEEASSEKKKAKETGVLQAPAYFQEAEGASTSTPAALEDEVRRRSI